MKFPKLTPQDCDLILDKVLGGLPQGYTFTRDDSWARVRYVVAYEGETLLQYRVGECETESGLFLGVRSLIVERISGPLRDATPEEKRLLRKAGEVMQWVKERLEQVHDGETQESD